MKDYRDIDSWQLCESGKEKSLQFPGIYSVWVKGKCLYVGMAEISIGKRVSRQSHPLGLAKHFYSEVELRYVEVEASKREILLEEALAMGQIKPEWNYGDKPLLPLKEPTAPIDTVRIHRKIRDAAQQLIRDLVQYDINILDDSDEEIDTEWVYKISSQSIEQTKEALENLQSVGLIEITE